MGFVDKEGKEVVKPIYDSLSSKFEEGLARVRKNDKWGYINKKGEEVVKLIYDDIDNFSNGLAGVKKYDKYGLIDKDGKEVVKPVYDALFTLGEGTVFVQKEDSWYIIDLKNPIYEVLIDLQDRTIRKQFFNENKADEFFNTINSYVTERSKSKDEEITILIENAQNDILKINNSYEDDEEKEFNNCYKKSMN